MVTLQLTPVRGVRHRTTAAMLRCPRLKPGKMFGLPGIALTVAEVDQGGVVPEIGGGEPARGRRVRTDAGGGSRVWERSPTV